MSSFKLPQPRGKFHSQDDWIVIQRFMQMSPGQPVRKVSSSRLRQWWRRGYVATRGSLDPQHLAEIEASYAKAYPEAAKIAKEVREAREAAALAAEEAAALAAEEAAALAAEEADTETDDPVDTSADPDDVEEDEVVPDDVEEDEVVPEDEGEDTVTAVSAKEGLQGWWTVTYSDGTTKKMRKAEVESLGLIEGADDGEV